MSTYNKKNFTISFTGDYATYFINKEKKTVACKIMGCLNTPLGDVFSEPYIMSECFEATGVARCVDTDIFDVEKGKRIALAKAENKIYEKASKYIQEYIKKTKELVNASEEFKDRAKSFRKHNEEFIERLSDNRKANIIKESLNKILNENTEHGYKHKAISDTDTKHIKINKKNK